MWGSGIAATFFLFLLMQGLVRSEQSPFDDVAKGNIVDFVPVVEDEEIQKKRRRPEPPPAAVEPPPDLPKPEFEPHDVGHGVELGKPKVERAVHIGKHSRFADGEYLPIVKVKPVYPRRAITRGIEGYVLLKFTVTKTGAVRDPVVVEAAPSGIFDRAAKDAALKFKYRPRVIDGEPIEVSGVLNRITFALGDE